MTEVSPGSTAPAAANLGQPPAGPEEASAQLRAAYTGLVDTAIAHYSEPGRVPYRSYTTTNRETEGRTTDHAFFRDGIKREIVKDTNTGDEITKIRLPEAASGTGGQVILMSTRNAEGAVSYELRALGRRPAIYQWSDEQPVSRVEQVRGRSVARPVLDETPWEDRPSLSLHPLHDWHIYMGMANNIQGQWRRTAEQYPADGRKRRTAAAVAEAALKRIIPWF